jgi:hypothetical protein
VPRQREFADVFPVWNAYCPECAEGSGPHDDLDDARAWQQQHNADNHQDAD